jgi:hypothetical protein
MPSLCRLPEIIPNYREVIIWLILGHPVHLFDYNHPAVPLGSPIWQDLHLVFAFRFLPPGLCTNFVALIIVVLWRQITNRRITESIILLRPVDGTALFQPNRLSESERA